MSEINYLSNFMDAIDTKLGLSSFVTNPDNLMWSSDPLRPASKEEEFPRFEFDILTTGDIEYRAQRLKTESTIFSVVGQLYYNKDTDVLKDKQKEVINFAIETRRNILSIHNDKVLGIDIAKGFIQILGMSEIFYDLSFSNKVGSFFITFEAEFMKYDTLCS